MDDPLRPATLAVLNEAGSARAHRPLNVPLQLSTQWEAATTDELGELFARRPDDGFYARFGHPTLRAAERKLAALEGAEDALVFSSGMGAIASTLFSVLRSGDHVVAQRSMFAQTLLLLRKLRDELGIGVSFVDATRPEEVRAAVCGNTRLVYVETPSNPMVDVVDIREVAGQARSAGALLAVDGTFAGPLVQRPLERGADLSLQSASKSLAGHADVLAGVVAGSAELVTRVRATRVLLGPTLGPHACWLLLRGLKTLAVRVSRQSDNAATLARRLAADPAVARVRYPLLEGSPFAAVAAGQMLGGGGMVSFELAGGDEAARAFAGGLRWIPYASSLGHVVTTIELPRELDFSAAELGSDDDADLPPGLIRMSVGIEDVADLEAEMARGLEAAARVVPGVRAGRSPAHR